MSDERTVVVHDEETERAVVVREAALPSDVVVQEGTGDRVVIVREPIDWGATPIPGLPGAGILHGALTYEQSTPSDLWQVNHNLGYYPNVTVVDSAGTQVEGEVRYIDANNIEIAFSAAFSGRVWFS